mmetsp:Transcript_131578/g.232516  ORF Transcript_131578/g.232516 Transcript_131578/m.232516 type:complete len:232 (+) Transcript_131578:102-797(+)
MTNAIARNGNFRQACLAINVRFINSACLLAHTLRIVLVLQRCGSECWASLELRLGKLQSIFLLATSRFAAGVLVDCKVTANLDVFQVVLYCHLILLCVVLLLISFFKILFRFGQEQLVFRDVFLRCSLLLLETCHVILILMLRCAFVAVRTVLLSLRVVKDSLKRADDSRPSGFLTCVVSKVFVRFLLYLLRDNFAVIVFIVCLQHFDCFSYRLLCCDKGPDVFLVHHVLI